MPNKLIEHQLPGIVDNFLELLEAGQVAVRVKPKIAVPTAQLTAKMWILPDGTVRFLNQWHWMWLKANPEVTKRYGIDKAVARARSEQVARVAALRVGFFRVNYEVNRGQLTIEGCSKFWRNKIKDTIFMLVLDNASKIDNMSVTLFSDNVSRVVKSADAQLFSYDEKEKLDHLPLISESERGKALRLIEKLVNLLE